MYFFLSEVFPVYSFIINLATDTLMDTLYTKQETKTNTTWGAMQQHAFSIALN